MTARARKYQPELETELGVTRLTPTFAAEIEGIDLAKPLDPVTIGAIADALVDHKLLVFRGQTLDPQSLREFGASFGPLHVHPLLEHDGSLPEIIVLDYDQARPPERDNWHTDVTFIETPPLGSVLYGEIIPETGGDTLFADLAASYAALSAPLRELLVKLRARHDFRKSFNGSTYYGQDNSKWASAQDKNPPVSHPVVRTHPVSGTKSLFVNEGFTTGIEGISVEESDALLRFLIAHQAKPEFSYRHRWRTGDVLFWDNRATQHMVVANYWPQHRRMLRATILGDRPV